MDETFTISHHTTVYFNFVDMWMGNKRIKKVHLHPQELKYRDDNATTTSIKSVIKVVVELLHFA